MPQPKESTRSRTRADTREYRGRSGAPDSLCLLFGRPCRQFERCAKAGVIVGQHQFAAMQVGNGVGKREPKSGPGGAAVHGAKADHL